MEIIIGKTAGFCLGVALTIEKANKALEEKKIYCLGEIVHNQQVIEKLENKGMITVSSIEDVPDEAKVIFRAHGEAPAIYDRAREKHLQILDLTCGNVKAIHKKVEREKKNAFVIIVGKKKHPEVIGTKGFSGENSYVVETEEDVLDAYMAFQNTGLERVYVVAQTTFSEEKFEKISKKIEMNFIDGQVWIDNTICMATTERQKETSKIAKKADMMFIIGGKNSSNTMELVHIAQENCKNVYSVQTINDLENIPINANIHIIGIMAGASTPQEMIDAVEEKIKKKIG